jgi:hypothetical protein
VENEDKYPHLLSVTSIFIRGSVVRYQPVGAVSSRLIMTHRRYVHLSKDDVELEVLQAKFLPAFSTAPHHQGLSVLIVCNRIQRARNLNAMPQKLLEQSSVVFDVKTLKI